MRALWYALLIAALAAGVAACGYKGKVRSPDQIQAADEKKAKKAAREANDEPSPEPAVPTPGAGANSQPPATPKPVTDKATGTSAGRITIVAPPADRDDQ